jgi:hypothetical protein
VNPLFSYEIAQELVADRVRDADETRLVPRRRRRSSLRRAAGAALIGAGTRLAGQK